MFWMLLVGLSLAASAQTAPPGRRSQPFSRSGVMVITKDGYRFFEGNLHLVEAKHPKASACYDDCLPCTCGKKNPLDPDCDRCGECWDFYWDCGKDDHRPGDNDDRVLDRESCRQDFSAPFTFTPVLSCNCSGNTAVQTSTQNNTQLVDCREQANTLNCMNTCNQAALACTENTLTNICLAICETSPSQECVDCLMDAIVDCVEAARTCVANSCGFTTG